MKVTLDYDPIKAKNKIERNLSRAQFILDSQILKDSNFYAPEDTGDLKASGITGSDLGSGILEWNMPYARYQYYMAPNKSKDKNPNARIKWFEFAKQTRKKAWIRLANSAAKGRS